VAIVSEALAGRFWPGERAVGRRLRIADRSGAAHNATVIGVLPSIRYRSLGEAPHALVYLPWSQWYRPDMSLYVKGDAAAVSLAGLLAEIEPDLPAEIRSMSEKTSFSLIPLRLAGGVLAGAGAIGVFLAATGVFGVVAYSVSRRKRELAIRMALGARAGRIRAMVVGGALRLTGMGLVVGLTAAILLARLLRGLLYGVGAADPPIIGLVLFLFAGVTVWASYVPAKRASALDPSLVLRED
jgi:ABC-type antimicrobial peptide transport system permease subunit